MPSTPGKYGVKILVVANCIAAYCAYTKINLRRVDDMVEYLSLVVSRMRTVFWTIEILLLLDFGTISPCIS